MPQGHGETTTLVLAVRQAGLMAPMVTAGAMNEPLFLADVRELRCPTLAPGDLVIWDNLSVHAVAGCATPLRRVGQCSSPVPPGSASH